MAIGIDDLDDDDILEPGQEPQIQEPPLNETPHQEEEGDFMSDFLKTRGIDDLNNINFQDDDGSITTRKWDELSNEEKINILNMPLETEEVEDNNGLTEDEVALLTQIRQSNMTPTEYLQSIAGEQVEVTPQYKIDELSDDEVYLLDLESRVGELTDEEAAQALNTAKSNEDFFKKQIEGIRKEYKEREDFKNQQDQAQIEQEQQEAFNIYRNSIIESIDNLNSIGNLDLNFDDNDKNYLAEFMLSQDESGKNYLYEALQDPETLTKAAWFILNGEEAFDSITEYFKNQIKLVSENQYKKGLEDGQKGIQSKPQVVINKQQNNHRTYKTINDLDDDD